jgi:YVTN family beta-propeller protein
VYVPDEKSGDVIVIDPVTRRIIGHMRVGAGPEHVTPDWDLSQLLVNVTYGNKLTPIDVRTGKMGRVIGALGPYNLYFSLDGSKAIVVRDSSDAPADQLYFYDRSTWKLLKTVSIDRAGADHMDMTADGRYALMSAEYSGYVIKIDVQKMEVVGELRVGGSPVDVRLSPDGSVFYVTDQKRNGVHIIDPVQMREVGFVPTDRGAHGLALSRDANRVFVANRYAGTMSVINVATRRVVARWRIGLTPDMLSLSADGSELWVSNRYSGSVSVVSTANGKVLTTVKTGGRPHGLAYFPQPGTLSLGHNGIYR